MLHSITLNFSGKGRGRGRDGTIIENDFSTVPYTVAGRVSLLADPVSSAVAAGTA